jgi:hypothetical protein
VDWLGPDADLVVKCGPHFKFINRF